MKYDSRYTGKDTGNVQWFYRKQNVTFTLISTKISMIVESNKTDGKKESK